MPRSRVRVPLSPPVKSSTWLEFWLHGFDGSPVENKDTYIESKERLPSAGPSILDSFRSRITGRLTTRANVLRGHLNVLDPTGRRWNRRAVFAHTLEMEFDRLPNGGFRLCRRAASRHATGQIRNVRRIVVAGGFNDDCIAHDIHLISSIPPAS